MRSFDFREVLCESCGRTLGPEEWERDCVACGGKAFSVEIERVSSGYDASIASYHPGSPVYGSGMLEVNLLVDLAFGGDTRRSPYFRTDALLHCNGVSQAAVAEFLASPLEDRIRLYVSWKRREVEAALPPGHRICPRCHVEFKVYDNEWGRAGLCSKACYHVFTKSGGKPG